MDTNRKTQFSVLILIIMLFTLQKGYGQSDFWQPTNGPYGGTVFEINSYPGGFMLAGTFYGLAYSTDSGLSWNSDLNFAYDVIGAVCIPAPSIFFAGYNRGLYRSTDNGNTWTNDSARLGNAWVYSISSKIDGPIFVGTKDAIYRSSDNGDTWIIVSNGLNCHSVYCFLFYDSVNTVFAGTGIGVFCSTNNGNSWSRLDSLTVTGAVFSLAKSPSGTLFAGATYRLFRSTNHGTDWSLDTTGFQQVTINCIAVDSTGIVYAGTNHGIFRSTNDGVRWNKLTSDLPSHEVFTLLVETNNTLLIGTDDGIYRSTDSGKTWLPRMNGLRKLSISNVSTLSNGSIYSTIEMSKAVFSTDFGNTWSYLQSGSLGSYSNFNTFACNKKGFLFAGTSEHIFRSTNDGIDWDTLKNGLPSYTYIKRFRFDSLGGIYAAGYSGMYKSTNDGDDWNALTFPPYTSLYEAIVDIASNGILLASTQLGIFENISAYNVYRSTDRGSTWTCIDSDLGLSANGARVGQIAISPDGDSYVIVSSSTSNTALFRSSDFGDNWHRVNFDSTISISQMVVNSEGKVFLGGNGVFCSTDKGNTWTSVVSGLGGTNVTSLSISNSGYLFAGTANGVYRSVQSTTSVMNWVPVMPVSTSLSHNYPNPFNPTTTIYFAIRSQSFVSLKVFDLIGREVATIISEEMPAGNYSRQWNAVKMSSGVYFYRLQAGSYSETKKLVLLK
jgi:photosystem II stability/assembly factor-like uncharacterized protein